MVPIANIEGVVVTASGPAAQNVQLTLVNLGFEVQGVGGNSTTRVDGHGRSGFHVAPGQYMLVARGTLGGRDPRAVEMQAVEERRAAVGGRGANPAQANDPARVWAMADVSVDGRDVANLVLTLQPGMTVSGRVAFKGSTAQPPTDLSRLRVSITPADPGGRCVSSRHLPTAASMHQGNSRSAESRPAGTG